MKTGFDLCLISFLFFHLPCCGSDGPKKEIRENLSLEHSEKPTDPFDFEVEFSGCTSISRGPVCRVSPSTSLTVWIKNEPNDELTFSTDRKNLPLEPRNPEIVQGGKRYIFELPERARYIRIESRRHGRWLLNLARESENKIIELAKKQRAEGKYAEATHLLLKELTTLSEPIRAAALSLLARLFLQQNKIEPAIEHFRRALLLHHRGGRIGAEVSDATALAYTLIYNGKRFAEARKVLTSVEPVPKGAALLQLYMNNVGGLLATTTGDLRLAHDRIVMAAEIAQRHGLPTLIKHTSKAVAVVYEKLGRYREAFEMYEEMWLQEKGEAPPCTKAWLLNAMGWVWVSAMEAGEKDVPDPIPWLEQAVSTFTQKCLENPSDLVNAHLSLALAYLHRQQPERATKILEESTKYGQGYVLRNQLWKIDVEARIALINHHPAEAKRLFARLLRRSQEVLDFEGEWRATLGIAQSLERKGRLKKSLEKYEEAAKMLGQGALRVALDEGRAAFLAERQKATERHVALLLRMKEYGRASDVVRETRSRALRTIFQISARRGSGTKWDDSLATYWKKRDKLLVSLSNERDLPVEYLKPARQRLEKQRLELNQILDAALSGMPSEISEGSQSPRLPAPGPLELILTYFEIDGKWYGFAADQEQVTLSALETLTAGLDFDTLSRRLLLPFAKQIGSSRRLRIVPHGFLEDVDFHKLIWNGDIILSTKQIVYGLDILANRKGLNGSHDRKDTGALHAAIVVDPDGNLDASRKEGEIVKKALQQTQMKQKYVITHLEQDQAKHSAVRAVLKHADLFHFSGHAAYRGYEGWDSALLLSLNDEFSLRDILALGRTPPLVFLNACESSKTDTGEVTALNLARAFVVAGSQRVIASTRPLPDDLAYLFAGYFYDYYKKSTFDEAFRRAQATLAAEKPDADWASLRLIVP